MLIYSFTYLFVILFLNEKLSNSFVLSCQAGSYLNQNACYYCLDGYYCPDGNEKILCPLGTYSWSLNAGIVKCTKCPLGSYANNTGSRSCKFCPDGHFCSDPSKSPIPCPLGSYSWSINDGISSCIKCPLGSYANNTGSKSCNYCPDGHFCCDPRKSPIPCPLGSYSWSINAGISECSRCSDGYYTTQIASTSCTACPNYHCPTPPVQVEECSKDYEAENDTIFQCDSSSTGFIQDASYLASLGDCNFYNELETENKCGLNGYLTKYGLKYCNKFNENINDFNEDGKKWVNAVRKCLMYKLLDSSLNECDSIKDYAFETHLDCYLTPGYGSKSVCEVWNSKNFVGLWNVYELIDFLEWKAIKQVLSTMKACAYNSFLDGYETAVKSFNSLLQSFNSLLASNPSIAGNGTLSAFNNMDDIFNLIA